MSTLLEILKNYEDPEALFKDVVVKKVYVTEMEFIELKEIAIKFMVEDMMQHTEDRIEEIMDECDEDELEDEDSSTNAHIDEIRRDSYKNLTSTRNLYTSYKYPYSK